MNKLLTVLATAALLLGAAAPVARADVFVLDILSPREGSRVHDADAYVGALALVARRHGGLRVSTFREPTAPGEPRGTVVWLWRFPSDQAVEALLADPAYASLDDLRARTFDDAGSSVLELLPVSHSPAH
jgi:uncharacterized protein (DUF1330 family)